MDDKPTYEQLLALAERPTLYVFPNKEGDVNFGTNIAELSHHQAIGFLQMAIMQLTTEVMGSAMRQRAEEQARSERYTTKLLVPPGVKQSP